jgi:hypothetical protein
MRKYKKYRICGYDVGDEQYAVADSVEKSKYMLSGKTISSCITMKRTVEMAEVLGTV